VASDNKKKKVSKKAASEKDHLEKMEKLSERLFIKENEILKTEEALVESMRRFGDIFEQSPIGNGIYSPKGELLMGNKSLFKIFEAKSFSSMPFQEIFTDFKLTAKQKRELKRGKSVSYEGRYPPEIPGQETVSIGNKKFLLVTLSPLLSEKERIGYMSQIQDITEQKKVEESQRLAQLGRLISEMAHEVNNPLMVISGRAELALLAGMKEGSVKDTMEIILDQCFMAKEIIQSLLKYSRVGKIDKESVDLARALTLITNILRHHFRSAGVMLELEIPDNLPQVKGNEKQLQEVLMNMVRNSADAMPNGGLIDIVVKKQGRQIKIEIKDTGKGMSAKVLNKIFDPFFTTKQNGTGLGLAVSHTIIQDHGGTLTYKSVVDKGTTAVIMLPINKK